MATTMMTNYQQKILDSTYDEIDMELADIVARLRDISDAVDRNITVTVTPDKKPVVLIDGEVNDRISFGEESWDGIPCFEGTMEQLNQLSIWNGGGR